MCHLSACSLFICSCKSVPLAVALNDADRRPSLIIVRIMLSMRDGVMSHGVPLRLAISQSAPHFILTISITSSLDCRSFSLQQSKIVCLKLRSSGYVSAMLHGASFIFKRFFGCAVSSSSTRVDGCRMAWVFGAPVVPVRGLQSQHPRQDRRRARRVHPKCRMIRPRTSLRTSMDSRRAPRPSSGPSGRRWQSPLPGRAAGVPGGLRLPVGTWRSYPRTAFAAWHC